MAKLEVLTAPDERLRVKAKPVPMVTDETRKIFDDMIETMYAEQGIGLAAIQVNIPQQIIVIDLQDRVEKTESKLYKICNPQILWKSEEISICNEGCLSVPEYRAEVQRAARVKVEYLNEDNKIVVMNADGLLATCIQHEIDHLNGKLFIDHLSPLKREMAIKKLLRLKKEQQAVVL